MSKKMPVEKVLKDIEQNHNCSWYVELYKRNINIIIIFFFQNICIANKKMYVYRKTFFVKHLREKKVLNHFYINNSHN